MDKQTKCMNRMVFCISVALFGANIGLGYLFAGEQTMVIYAWKVLIIQFGIVCLPAMFFINRYGSQQNFGLRRICFSQFVWSVVLGAGVFFCTTGLNAVCILGLETLGVAIPKTSLYVNNSWLMLLALLLVSLIPAYTEELLLRGAMLHTYAQKSPRRAAVITSLVFALLHFKPYSIVSLFPLGLLLSAVTLKTQSCYTSMTIHFTNNFLVASLSTLSNYMQANRPTYATTVPLNPSIAIGFYLLIGVLLCFIGYNRLMAATARRSVESAPQKVRRSKKAARNPAAKRIQTAPLALSCLFLCAVNVCVCLRLFGVI